MLTGLVADIHGNIVGLEAVLKDGAARGVKRWCCLGDIAFKGPAPEECIAAIMRVAPDLTVMGNTEEWLPSGPPAHEGGTAEAKAALRLWWEWMIQRLDKAQVDWVKTLSASRVLTPPGLLLVHATAHELEKAVLPSAQDSAFAEAFETADHSLVACAHIHVPYLRPFKGCRVFNTGSAGRPLDGDPRASYVILNDEGGTWSLEFRRVEYDVERAIRLADDRRFPSADAFANAIRRGANF